RLSSLAKDASIVSADRPDLPSFSSERRADSSGGERSGRLSARPASLAERVSSARGTSGPPAAPGLPRPTVVSARLSQASRTASRQYASELTRPTADRSSRFENA